jgi:hypothetical protein
MQSVSCGHLPVPCGHRLPSNGDSCSTRKLFTHRIRWPLELRLRERDVPRRQHTRLHARSERSSKNPEPQTSRYGLLMSNKLPACAAAVNVRHRSIWAMHHPLCCLIHRRPVDVDIRLRSEAEAPFRCVQPSAPLCTKSVRCRFVTCPRRTSPHPQAGAPSIQT